MPVVFNGSDVALEHNTFSEEEGQPLKERAWRHCSKLIQLRRIFGPKILWSEEDEPVKKSDG